MASETENSRVKGLMGYANQTADIKRYSILNPQLIQPEPRDARSWPFSQRRRGTPRPLGEGWVRNTAADRALRSASTFNCGFRIIKYALAV